MFEHKRPLYAFLLVTMICAIVVGTTMRSQALFGQILPLAGPSAIVGGHVFAATPAAAAAADEPDAAHVKRPGHSGHARTQTQHGKPGLREHRGHQNDQGQCHDQGRGHGLDKTKGGNGHHGRSDH